MNKKQKEGYLRVMKKHQQSFYKYTSPIFTEFEVDEITINLHMMSNEIRGFNVEDHLWKAIDNLVNGLYLDRSRLKSKELLQEYVNQLKGSLNDMTAAYPVIHPELKRLVNCLEQIYQEIKHS